MLHVWYRAPSTTHEAALEISASQAISLVPKGRLRLFRRSFVRLALSAGRQLASSDPPLAC